MAVGGGWWDKPVRIERPDTGRPFGVSNNNRAAELLLNEWPTEPGPKHLAARKAVLKAMEKALDAKRQAAKMSADRFDLAEADAIVGVNPHHIRFPSDKMST